MGELGARQLAVRSQGRLCGVLTERDVRLADAALIAEEGLTVRAVMSTDFYPVAPLAPLAHVVKSMALHDYQCAVVVEEGRVRGVFTTAHAMRALSELLEQQAPVREGLGPGEIREVILTEHIHVESLLERTREAAELVRESSVPKRHVSALRDAAAHLLLAMGALLELETRALAPALRDLPGYGQERALQLAQEHRRQMDETEAMVDALAQADPSQPPSVLAERLEVLTRDLRALLESEQELFLNQELLRDDGIVTDFTAG